MRISDWSSDVCSSDLKVKQSCIGRTTVDRCHAVRRFRWRSSIRASPPSCIFDSGTWPAGRKIEPVAAAQDVEPDIINGQCPFGPGLGNIGMRHAETIDNKNRARRSEEQKSELQSIMR